MKQIIHIGTDIDLADLLQSRCLIQANSGGGKTVIARTIIEGSYGKVPFIIFDDAGEYFPLKEKFGDIVIIGGEYADVQIGMQSVKMLPKFIIENQLNVVIDLSAYDKQYTRTEYVKHFLDALMALGKQYWKPYLIFLEEAHKYCGEQDKQISAGAVKELMSGGRKKGYCGILITQRIAKLHKDAAAECNNKFIGRTWLDLDMDRAAKELGFTKSSEFTRLSLRDLQPGSFYAFGTSIEPHHVHKVKIKMPETKIIKVGQIIEITPQKPTKTLLAAMDRLNELPKDAAKELKTIKELQDEVLRLKKELAGKKIPQKAGASDEISVVTEQLNKTKAYVFELQNEINELTVLKNLYAKLRVTRKVTISKVVVMLEEAKQHLSDLSEQEKKPEQEKYKPQKQIRFADTASLIKRDINKKTIPESNGRLPKGEHRVLTAIAQHQGLSRKALTTITGYTRRTRDAYIFALRSKGMAELSGSEIVATDAGIEALGKDFEPLPQGRQLQEYWLQELPAGEKRILEVLLQADQDSALSRDHISTMTGYTRRTRDAYLYNMLAKQIIETPDKGMIKVSELLFD